MWVLLFTVFSGVKDTTFPFSIFSFPFSVFNEFRRCYAVGGDRLHDVDAGGQGGGVKDLL